MTRGILILDLAIFQKNPAREKFEFSIQLCKKRLAENRTLSKFFKKCNHWTNRLAAISCKLLPNNLVLNTMKNAQLSLRFCAWYNWECFSRESMRQNYLSTQNTHSHITPAVYPSTCTWRVDWHPFPSKSPCLICYNLLIILSTQK